MLVTVEERRGRGGRPGATVRGRSGPLGFGPPAGGARPAVLAHAVFQLVQAIVLGLLQGVTEFLPVSSSGHLQGVPYLLGWQSGSLSFDVMVHAGTLAAVLAYFRADLWYLATRSIGVGVADDGEQCRARRVILLLAVGTVPAAVAGAFFEDVFAATFESPRAVALFLYVTAGLLTAAEILRRRRPPTNVFRTPSLPGDADRLGSGTAGRDMRLRDAALIGVAQAFAMFPGISRAGSTIAAGMLLGQSRAAATRFSFLLAIPVVTGATITQLPDLGRTEAGTLPFGPLEITAGVVAAALSGYWAIRFLLRVVQTDDLLGFARYVAAFGTVLLAATFVM